MLNSTALYSYLIMYQQTLCELPSLPTLKIRLALVAETSSESSTRLANETEDSIIKVTDRASKIVKRV